MCFAEAVGTVRSEGFKRGFTKELGGRDILWWFVGEDFQHSKKYRVAKCSFLSF